MISSRAAGGSVDLIISSRAAGDSVDLIMSGQARQSPAVLSATFIRVTKASGDAGVDVIAHRDELGFEPPLIKVQCKQTLGTNGRPDVQKALRCD